MKQVLVSKLNKTLPKGKPRQRWLDRAKKDLIQVVESAIIENIDDRDQWTGLVETAKGLNGLYNLKKKNYVCITKRRHAVNYTPFCKL